MQRLIEALVLKDLGKVSEGLSLIKSDLIKRYSCRRERTGKTCGTKEERPAGASAGCNPHNEMPPLTMVKSQD